VSVAVTLLTRTAASCNVVGASHRVPQQSAQRGCLDSSNFKGTASAALRLVVGAVSRAGVRLFQITIPQIIFRIVHAMPAYILLWQVRISSFMVPESIPASRVPSV